MPRNALQIVDPVAGGEIPDNPLMQGARAPVMHENLIQPLRLSMPGGDATPLRVFHGSPHDFQAFDSSKVGSEAITRRWTQDAQHSNEYYLTTSPRHAENYGLNIHEFQIDAPLLQKDAKVELEAWAKDQGYNSAQEHIDDYYDGSPYDALTADEYFKDALREAKKAGYPGAQVTFGNLKMRQGGSRVPVGDVVVLHDPAAATWVGTRKD